ncbi:TetR/AcrR family transcriptional regulator [Kutzneria buriramensis]|uniref:Regulatory TetR family protein n=1 Tax=Kutzneria buriramensis TaxID=1045776 RepID=A0A3E0IAF7_9PSEU|nr:TetR/AcrR family transcriptional regulator [Kutzneria buriramensis]REH55724.1 regulatory TetR family protein [Kutzneria buriramensis]
MRADARRNRELIVRAATRVFMDTGCSGSMEDIAQAAGLGVGTLYRHFPDRAGLLALITCDVVSRLAAQVEAAAATDLPRWEVLLGYVRDAVREPLAMLKSVSTDDPVVAGPAERLHAVLGRVVEGAQAEGSLRADLETAAVTDLLGLVVCRPGARDDDPLATVVLDGLRAPGLENRPDAIRGQ